MTRFLRFVSSLLAAASIVCFAISAASFGGAAFADEQIINGCGPYSNNGRCEHPENCTGTGNYCTEHATCPCANDPN